MTKAHHETERLILRSWQEDDREPFALMNADPKVMEYFPSLCSRQKSDYIIDYSNDEIEDSGYGFWAAQRKDTNQFIGFIGLHQFNEDLPFCPMVEIGWRLAKEHWGQGFATEGAKESLSIGFSQLSLKSIYSMSVLDNLKSQRVMSKIGMTNVDENFLHPAISAESGLQEHCLFKIDKKQWESTRRAK